MTAPTIPEGYVLVPAEPDHAVIKAMAESRAVDDEGDFPAMLDLLDFSGQNKTCAVLRAAYAAAIAAAPAIPLPAAPVQEWVSVKDRLPEVGQGVLAYRPTAEQTQDPAITITFYTGRMKESWQGIEHGFDCLCHPTHWMPLPTLPPPPVGENE